MVDQKRRLLLSAVSVSVSLKLRCTQTIRVAKNIRANDRRTSLVVFYFLQIDQTHVVACVVTTEVDIWRVFRLNIEHY